jgi:hypothetical protein
MDAGSCTVELLAFKSPAYVYSVPPARSAAGHRCAGAHASTSFFRFCGAERALRRAEDWDVNKWLAEVQCKLLTRSDDTAVLRLEAEDTGELFAACPLPRSGPVAAAVEPVIDSSRDFVLRVEDEASKRHAFLGLGFRSRDAASDLKMALADYEKQLQRSAEAARRRDAHELAAGAADAAPGAAPAAALRDLSLKDKISVSVPVRRICVCAAAPDSALSARVLRRSWPRRQEAQTLLRWRFRRRRGAWTRPQCRACAWRRRQAPLQPHLQPRPRLPPLPPPPHLQLCRKGGRRFSAGHACAANSGMNERFAKQRSNSPCVRGATERGG